MFDPSELTVKDARSRLSGLGLDDLEAVLASEIDGKHRSSLIAEIGRAIDALKTAEEDAVEEPAEDLAEEPVEEEVAAEPADLPPAKRRVRRINWFRLSREARRAYRALPDGDFEEI